LAVTVTLNALALLAYAHPKSSVCRWQKAFLEIAHRAKLLCSLAKGAHHFFRTHDLNLD
jgi:hypothetical protein